MGMVEMEWLEEFIVRAKDMRGGGKTLGCGVLRGILLVFGKIRDPFRGEGTCFFSPSHTAIPSQDPIQPFLQLQTIIPRDTDPVGMGGR